MSTESPAPKVLKAKKEKKEKSSKKRNTGEATSSATEQDLAAPTASKTTSAQENVESADQISTKKEKKEKLSKKRKAAEVTEDAASNDPSLSKSTKEASTPPTSTSGSPEPPTKKHKKANADVAEIEVDVTLPEPPSKKALRRLKKGKPLPPSKSGAEPDASSKPEKEKKEVEKRSEYGVWIGNLPFFVSKDDLKKFLVEYSDIEADTITRIHMKGPDDKKSANKIETKRVGKVQHNTGFAYVDFSTALAVAQAIELSEQLLSGRRVLIKDAKSFAGRPEKTKEEQRQDGKPPSKKIFVGNLAYDNTEDSLTAHFEKCGEVESVKVATFEDSGKCKGYAWVVFAELEGARNAVKGFVMIADEEEEEEEDEENADSASNDDDNDENSPSASDSDTESTPESKSTTKPSKTKPTPTTRPKLRKWWVNKIKGRPLRMEYAEDAQVRYKKRYGGKEGGTKRRVEDGDADSNVKEYVPREKKGEQEYMLPHAGPRLTGGIVESTGKKITF